MANKPKCAIEGCNCLAMSTGYLRSGNHRYSKYCTKHHKQRYGMLFFGGKDRQKAKILNSECALCGWEGHCHRHRLQMGRDGGKYIKENVIILCPNCHSLIHEGKLTIK